MQEARVSLVRSCVPYLLILLQSERYVGSFQLDVLRFTLSAQGAVHPTPDLPVTSLLAIIILAAAFFLTSGLSPGNSRPVGLPLLIAFCMSPVLFRVVPTGADFIVAGLTAYGTGFTCLLARRLAYMRVLHRSFAQELIFSVRSQVSANFALIAFLP